jgi:hypothetical protein
MYKKNERTTLYSSKLRSEAHSSDPEGGSKKAPGIDVTILLKLVHLWRDGHDSLSLSDRYG